MREFTAVSLFCGAGGLDMGFENAGIKTIWANDFDKDACKTHQNWSSAEVVCGDVSKIDMSIIPESDKDYSNDSAYIQIMIAANNYAESVELDEQVRTSLVHKKGIIQTIPVEDISLVDGSEEFIDNTFVQNLIFKITIQ